MGRQTRRNEKGASTLAEHSSGVEVGCIQPQSEWTKEPSIVQISALVTSHYSRERKGKMAEEDEGSSAEAIVVCQTGQR